ncbi:MAG: hypothetical protein IIA19_03955 [Thaumarchaeota archaeon]|nr:hypothetical protein [Nitrososphaerota archaeon]
MSHVYVLKKEGLEEEKIKQALDILLETKFKSEFREISNMVLPKSGSEPIKNWEQFVMNFCLDLNEAFKTWSGDSELTPTSPQKALTILRQLSMKKTAMNQLAYLMNIAYDLAEQFKEIYRRL